MIVLFDLNGKTVLVTGASSGIGKQTAYAIAQRGGRLVITGRNLDRLKQTYESLAGQNHIFVQADLTIPGSRERIVDSAPEINGLVNCAGQIKLYPYKIYSEKRLIELFSINYEAAVLLTAELLNKKKIKDGASIIFVTSVISIVGTETNGVYAGTKGALAGTMKCLALEIAPRKIRVNCVSPAFVKTPMLDRLSTQVDISIFERLHPLGLGEAEDVANSIIYLLSDESRWVTGTNLILDGGYSAK
jgi:NAD(P)-dependent dehydrogenase (short-subunit alcohol dehydrogenase family)